MLGIRGDISSLYRCSQHDISSVHQVVLRKDPHRISDVDGLLTSLLSGSTEQQLRFLVSHKPVVQQKVLLTA